MARSEMDWEKLMSPKRYHGNEPLKADDDKSEVRSPFVKDTDKIIHASAFRRLQAKTQLHTFPGSDYVRTRLTHSLEVASVGRTLGIALGCHLIGHKEMKIRPHQMKTPLERADFGNVVAAAALAHDIGNPPFGHAGEQAIRHWFAQEARESRKERQSLLKGIALKNCSDLEYFEGNAQGFRILTRLKAWRNEGGLRLTCATLGTFQKYPLSSRLVPTHSKNKKKPQLSYPPNKKFSYFQDDYDAMEKIAKELGLLPSKEYGGAWCRHPLAFLLEAADDICNAIADVEDGYKYAKLDFKWVETIFRSIAKAGPGKKLNPAMAPDVSRYSKDEKIAYLRAQAVGALIYQTLNAYRQYESAIMAGKFTGNLMDEIASRDELEQIKKTSKEKLFLDESTLRAELAGYEVIYGLLDIFVEALLGWEENGWEIKGLPPHFEKTLELLRKSMHPPKSRYEWLLCVTDYVSGMTDKFAINLYRRLKGISVPSVLQ